MRVWQPGGHLTRQRDAHVDDWSWQQTARRIKTLAMLAAPYKRQTALALFFLFAATATALAPPYLAKLAIDDGIQEENLRVLAIVVVLFVVAGVLSLVTSAAQTYFTGWTGERILADLRNKLFRHLQRLSLGYYERNRAGVIISRLTNDVEALDQLVTDGVTTLVQSTLFLLGTSVILFFLDWRLALATLTVLPLMFVATAFFRIYSARAYRAVRERLGLVTATLAEDIGGMRVIQAFRREQTNDRIFREVNAHYREANQQTVVLNGLYFPFVDFLSALATAIVLGYGGYLAFHGSVEVGTLLAFVLYLSNFFDPVQQLSQLYNTFLSAVAALDKIMDVMDEEPEVRDKPGARDLDRINGGVGFENVRFGYGDGPEVLHGIDLDVPAGTTVALVGHTGAGKSTIAKLLARFYDPRDGRITIDGVDLRDVTQASLRRQLGCRAAGGLPLRRHRPRQHRLRPAGCRPGGGGRGGEGRRRARIRPRARGRLRDAPPGARNPALARPAPARRLRSRAARRPADPDPRRGDLVRRHRHRAPHRERAPDAARRPDRLRHRPPPLHDPRRRPDRRPRARQGRRAGHARRADGQARPLHVAVRRLGRGRLTGYGPRAS